MATSAMNQTMGPMPGPMGPTGPVVPGQVTGMMPTGPDSMLGPGNYQGVASNVRSTSENGSYIVSKTKDDNSESTPGQLSNDEDGSKSPQMNSTPGTISAQSTTTTVTTVAAPVIRQPPMVSQYPVSTPAPTYGMPPPGYQGGPGFGGYPGMHWGVPPQSNPYMGMYFLMCLL